MKTLAFIIGSLLLASPLAAQLRVDNNYKDLTQRNSQRDDRVKKRQQEAEAKKKADEEAKKKAAEEAKRREQQQQIQARRGGAPGQQNAANSKNPNAKGGKQGPSKGYGATEPTGTEVTQIMLNAVKTRKVYFNPERMAEKKSVILLNPMKKPVDSADQIGSIVSPL